MWPTTSPRTDRVRIVVWRFGHFDRLARRRLRQRHHANAARDQSKLLRRAAGEVDHADALGRHPIGDRHVDRLPGLLPRHPYARAEREHIVRRG